MTDEIKSTNPVVKAIVSGTAPQPARLAAARGMLPLPQGDLLEILVALQSNDDVEIADAAKETLKTQEPESLLPIAGDKETAPSVLAHLAAWTNAGKQIHEAIAINTSTPDDAIAKLASVTNDGSVLEIILVNQQRLLRVPAIIDAVLNNPARTPEAERHARETRTEFFEKERGAQQIAEELRVRGNAAAAEFVEKAESIGASNGISLDDVWLIAKHIEVSDDDIDDSWLSLELIEEFYEESYEQRLANAERVIGETLLEMGEQTPERVNLIRRIFLMSVKDRAKLAMKGDREARAILIRDSNRVVSTAVINNPRITDQEVESISAMRTVSNDVLRIISMNRAWTRSYQIIHNLARNPRTPVPTAMNILPRLHTKDLKAITLNRNVSDAIRRQAQRLYATRGMS